jgi:hypothetical protein
MANSAKVEKEERIWDDPMPVDQKIPVALSSKHLIEQQTVFLQDNPEYIYRYLQDMRWNNQRATGYTFGLLFICIGVMIHFMPLLLPEMTNDDLIVSFLLGGVGMFIIATVMAKVQQV